MAADEGAAPIHGFAGTALAEVSRKSLYGRACRQDYAQESRFHRFNRPPLWKVFDTATEAWQLLSSRPCDADIMSRLVAFGSIASRSSGGLPRFSQAETAAKGVNALEIETAALCTFSVTSGDPLSASRITNSMAPTADCPLSRGIVVQKNWKPTDILEPNPSLTTYRFISACLRFAAKRWSIKVAASSLGALQMRSWGAGDDAHRFPEVAPNLGRLSWHLPWYTYCNDPLFYCGRNERPRLAQFIPGIYYRETN